MRKKIFLIAAARPNFMKVAPLWRAMAARPASLEPLLIHTGQHYDHNMSDVFFEDLGLPTPHVHLGVGGGSHAQQTAGVMLKFEELCLSEKPDLVVVVGDVNATMATAITAAKLHIPVAHVEAGLRSRDMTMPEEINRLLTDSIADLLFTPSPDADANLAAEGVAPSRVRLVGNIMIDSLVGSVQKARSLDTCDRLGLVAGEFGVVTLHRPANVDDAQGFARLLRALADGVRGLPVVFPVHPRTAKTLAALPGRPANVLVVEPQPYLEFNWLVRHAKGVITDSGGITEETTVLGVPCLTLRDTTERPETVAIGTNELIGTDPAALQPALDRLFAGRWKRGAVPELWDGRSGERIAAILEQLLCR